MPNTQEVVLPRTDRPLTNTCHEVVEAHGETSPDHVEESDFDGHLDGEHEHKGELDERVTKASKVAERHVTSKNGLQVAAERKSSNEAARTEHQKAWDSNKKSVVPEQKKRK
jgi:hypothetical protein